MLLSENHQSDHTSHREKKRPRFLQRSIAPVPGFPAPLISNSQTSPEEDRFHVQVISIDVGYDSEIFPSTSFPQGDSFRSLQDLLNHPLGRLGHPFFSEASAPDLRCVRPPQPHGDISAQQGMNPGNVEADGVSVIVAEINDPLQIPVSLLGFRQGRRK